MGLCFRFIFRFSTVTDIFDRICSFPFPTFSIPIPFSNYNMKMKTRKGVSRPIPSVCNPIAMYQFFYCGSSYSPNLFRLPPFQPPIAALAGHACNSPCRPATGLCPRWQLLARPSRRSQLLARPFLAGSLVACCWLPGFNSTGQQFWD